MGSPYNQQNTFLIKLADARGTAGESELDLPSQIH